MVQTSNVSTRNAAKICKELVKSGIDIPTPSQSGVYKASIKAAERMEETYVYGYIKNGKLVRAF